MTRHVEAGSTDPIDTLHSMVRRHKQELRFGGLDLTFDEAAALDRSSTIIDIPAGAMLCRQGRAGRQLVWILDGIAAVVRDEQVIALAGQGDVVGEGTMLGAHDVCSADVVARTPLTVAVLSRHDWLTVSDEVPTLIGRLFDLALEREPRLAA